MAKSIELNMLIETETGNYIVTLTVSRVGGSVQTALTASKDTDEGETLNYYVLTIIDENGKKEQPGNNSKTVERQINDATSLVLFAENGPDKNKTISTGLIRKKFTIP